MKSLITIILTLTLSSAGGSTNRKAQIDYQSMIQRALKVIKMHEGCKLRAYKDPKTGGLPITIGYGSTRKLNGQAFKLGDTITQKEAELLLIRQVKESYIPKLQRIPHWSEMQVNHRVALISFGYNLGANFYGSSRFNTLSGCLKRKEWKKVPKTLQLYSNPKSKAVHAGLLKRRIAEGAIWASN